jgi:hypothetical protein
MAFSSFNSISQGIHKKNASTTSTITSTAFIHYKFKDATNSGTGGSTYNGTLIGTDSFTSSPSPALPSKLSSLGLGALSVSDSNGKFSVNSAVANSVSVGFTICLWSYPQNGNGSIFSLGTSTSQSNYSNLIEFFGSQYLLVYGTSNNILGQVNGSATNNVWQHHAFVFSNSGITYYYNGVSTNGSSVITPGANRSVVYIGNGIRSTGTSGGYIADFRIYQSQLTSTQISDIYNGTA